MYCISNERVHVDLAVCAHRVTMPALVVLVNVPVN